MPPVTPTKTPATGTLCPAARRTELLRLRGAVGEGQLAARDLLHGHREVVLRARLDEGRRRILEAHALAQLMVVVVDLPRPLRGHDHERIPRRGAAVGRGAREKPVGEGP